MRSSYFADLLHIARRCVPFTSIDGQDFVRLDEPLLQGVRLINLSLESSAALPENSPSESAALSQLADSEELLAA
jgi:hypothetical protein